MKKENLQKCGYAVMGIAIAVLLFQNYSMGQKLNRLESRCQQIGMELQQTSQNLSYKLSNQTREIESLLEKGQSLFSELSADVALSGKQFAVTVRAVPKALAADEKMIARITTENGVYEKEMGADHQAVLMLDLAETLQPVCIIQSAVGVKQESLPEIDGEEILSSAVFSEWGYGAENERGKHVFSLWAFYNEQNVFDLKPEDIESAEFVIVDSGIRENPRGNGSENSAAEEVARPVSWVYEVTSEFWDTLEGEHVPAEVFRGNKEWMLRFQADFSEYMNKQDSIRYEVYFTLTTKDGLRFVTWEYPVASFSSSLGTMTTDAGDGMSALRPILKKQ